MKLTTALAIEYPSNVDVPLPNSSITTRDLRVAYLSIVAVSSISTKKVDLPSRIRSEAPILVNTLSKSVILQDSAGTKQPT